MLTFRRKRFSPILRDLLQETKIDTDDFIYPLFIRDGEGIKREISSMPNVYQMSIDEAIKECDELLSLGIKAIILFGIPEIKDSIGSDALCENGIISRAIKEIKKAKPQMFVVTDLCFCEYTDHGHCGVLNYHLGSVDNEATLVNLARQAIVHARAGADMIAPSGMMDGMIKAIREALNNEGFAHIPIMSYSSKFASSYYGPFRDVSRICS